MITGTTRVAGVIGDPVRHSLSPRLHNAAYEALGLDWVFAAFEVRAGDTAAALDAARALGFVGLSVTMPHKTAMAELCDDLSPDAAALRSVNTVHFTADGRAAADSTDGAGFLRCSTTQASIPKAVPCCSWVPVARRGRSHTSSGQPGARVVVAARRREAASEAAGLAHGEAIPWDDRTGAAAGVDIVVNATPVGMAGDGALPIPAELLRPAQVVVDLVYEPLETPLLAAARARGARTVGGLGMLVHQAARQVEIWSGRAAPVDAMRAAVGH